MHAHRTQGRAHGTARMQRLSIPSQDVRLYETQYGAKLPWRSLALQRYHQNHMYPADRLALCGAASFFQTL